LENLESSIASTIFTLLSFDLVWIVLLALLRQ